MKKTYLGSAKLSLNFKMFRIKYSHPKDVQRIRQNVMQKMNNYLDKNDGRLINVKQLKACNQLIFYFVTGEQGFDQNWQQYLRNNLLKQYHVIPNVIEIGPSFA